MNKETSVICVLHPGKTGGTYLKSVIRHNKGRWTRPIKLLSHRETVASTAQDFGPDRKLAFTFRDPFDRFISAFESRRRQGRPTYNRVWSPAEATAFLYFDTPNALAEALDATDERTKSAAYFAFNAIIHLRSDYAFHFESLQTLEEERDNILACIDVSNLDSTLSGFLNHIGIDTAEIPENARKHANPAAVEALSDRAATNLSQYWAVEFEFYAAFKKIEARGNR
ncbi:sulfotransferase family 2 domain-containing protein [uncultured Roseovarius sp.]|uniref:sulfotransferase family 2 domain-containing protein n=1 Tax=uncultured Roseovarius sp. TaxID=293344 RepID=UPI00262A9168|nr:sulfotransferase family 2 domain-containing protein [uncultured Roseovarius sp.]